MYSVKATAGLTGLTPETLRAWERRYAAVVPHRDDKGRRSYDAAMLQRLTLLYRLTDRGHAISRLAALDDAALQGLLENSRQLAYGAVDDLPGRMLDAIADYQVDVFDRELTVAIATLPLSVLIGRLVNPLLHEVGVRWADGRLAIAQERLVSSLLQARLLSILNQHPRGHKARVLFATLPGEQHQLGLIGAALQAFDAGVPVLYLGAELPAVELARVANRVQAAAVAISSIYPAHAGQVLDELRSLDAALHADIPVWLGGANAAYLGEELALPRLRVIASADALRHLALRV